MKKYLLSIAVALMAAVTFTACSNDDDDPSGDSESLAKTTWVGTMVDEDGTLNVTISFDDEKNGIQYAEGTITEEGFSIPIKEYAKFTYSLKDGKGKATASLITVVTPFGPETQVPEAEDADINFTYDSKNNQIIITEEGEVVTTLKKAKYEKIEFVQGK